MKKIYYILGGIIGLSFIIGGYFFPRIGNFLGRSASLHSAIDMAGNNITRIGIASTTSLYVSNGDFRIYNGNNDYINLVASSSDFTSYNFRFPKDDGDTKELLQTDGEGNLDWVATSSLEISINTIIRTTTCNLNGEAPATCTATVNCSAGEIVYGGGFSDSITTSLGNWHNRSYPSSTTAWTCVFYTDNSRTDTMTCYAICAI